MSQQLWHWSVAQIVTGVRTRSVSAREVVLSVLDRLDSINPAINAVVSVQRQDALARADALDNSKELRVGRLPLLGVPVTTKINTDQKGLPTTNGVVAFQNNIATEDAPAIRNLRHSGAIIIGRTNVPAFSMRWATENDLHGRTLNPWNATRTPGGSSGGAAAAVSAGIGPVAQGNDGGGSLRYPAYCCGVVGLRPSLGRVPNAPQPTFADPPLAAQLISVQGPIGKRVADVRSAVVAMSSSGEGDPGWVEPVGSSEFARGIKVAFCPDPTGRGTHPSIGGALKRAADILERAGYIVEETIPPQFNEAVDLWHAIAAQARYVATPLIEAHADRTCRQMHDFTVLGNPYQPERFINALTRRTRMQRAWAAFLTEYPILLSPVTNELPFVYGEDWNDAASVARMYDAIAPLFVQPALGIPAISVPVGLSDGLPVGVQLTAARFQERLILDAAEVIEREAAIGFSTPTANMERENANTP